jgi:nucleotide-binding universal stress UspA family protein
MATRTSICVRNILLPTDFSDESVHAIDYVRGLRRHYHANVYVVHVLDLLPFSLSSDPAAVARSEEISRTGNERMEEFIRTHNLNEEEFEPVLLSGEVSSAVDKFAREREIDLIVLGSRGDVGISRLFQGSMAEEIFRTAHCPVMVVGPKAKMLENGGVFNRLFFPTDLGRFSSAALPYVEFLLTGNSQAKVSLAHFMEQDPGTAYERHKLRRQVESELTAMIPSALRHQIEDVVVEFCSPAEGMIATAHGLTADLLVMGVRYGGSFIRAATHGLRSITHRIISQVSCPVLTVREL